MNPYTIVNLFEKEVADYTGAPYAVAVNSCTSALFLSLKYRTRKDYIVSIPKYTYKSVADAIVSSGCKIHWLDKVWTGVYELEPFNIWDAAKRFTSGMYSGGDMCLSFHGRKILNIGEGGMILTDNKKADMWYRLARFNGRHEVNYYDDTFAMIGWKMNMAPEQAARGLTLMNFIKRNNPDQIEAYTNLSGYEFYKPYVSEKPWNQYV